MRTREVAPPRLRAGRKRQSPFSRRRDHPIAGRGVERSAVRKSRESFAGCVFSEARTTSTTSNATSTPAEVYKRARRVRRASRARRGSREEAEPGAAAGASGADPSSAAGSADVEVMSSSRRFRLVSVDVWWRTRNPVALGISWLPLSGSAGRVRGRAMRARGFVLRRRGRSRRRPRRDSRTDHDHAADPGERSCR